MGELIAVILLAGVGVSMAVTVLILGHRVMRAKREAMATEASARDQHEQHQAAMSVALSKLSTLTDDIADLNTMVVALRHRICEMSMAREADHRLIGVFTAERRRKPM